MREPTDPVAARRAVGAIFFINGAVIASWVPHIPALKERHAIDDGELGLVLLAMAAGAVLALPVAGWLVGRMGSRLVTSVAATALCVALPLPVLSPSVPLLSLALVLLGACNATLDVAMNAQAVVVERRYRRAIMSSFHGLFSLGGLAGASAAGLAMAIGVPGALHVIGTAIVCAVAVGCCLPWLVPSIAPGIASGRVFARPTGVLLRL